MHVVGSYIYCGNNDDMLRTMREIRANGGEVVLSPDAEHTLIVVKEEKSEGTDTLHDPFGYYGNHT